MCDSVDANIVKSNWQFWLRIVDIKKNLKQSRRAARIGFFTNDFFSH